MALESHSIPTLHEELETQQKLFEELSRRLLDEGMVAIVLDAWARADEERPNH